MREKMFCQMESQPSTLMMLDCFLAFPSWEEGHHQSVHGLKSGSKYPQDIAAVVLCWQTQIWLAVGWGKLETSYHSPPPVLFKPRRIWEMEEMLSFRDWPFRLASIAQWKHVFTNHISYLTSLWKGQNRLVEASQPSYNSFLKRLEVWTKAFI